jgi:hypothetical protein
MTRGKKFSALLNWAERAKISISPMPDIQQYTFFTLETILWTEIFSENFGWNLYVTSSFTFIIIMPVQFLKSLPKFNKGIFKFLEIITSRKANLFSSLLKLNPKAQGKTHQKVLHSNFVLLCPRLFRRQLCRQIKRLYNWFQCVCIV